MTNDSDLFKRGGEYCIEEKCYRKREVKEGKLIRLGTGLDVCYVDKEDRIKDDFPVRKYKRMILKMGINWYETYYTINACEILSEEFE